MMVRSMNSLLLKLRKAVKFYQLQTREQADFHVTELRSFIATSVKLISGLYITGNSITKNIIYVCCCKQYANMIDSTISSLEVTDSSIHKGTKESILNCAHTLGRK